jgi:acetyl esterase/lipase
MNVFGAPLAGAVAEPVHRTDGAIYFIHGSGFALCSPRTHRRPAASLSRLTRLPVFSVAHVSELDEQCARAPLTPPTDF